MIKKISIRLKILMVGLIALIYIFFTAPATISQPIFELDSTNSYYTLLSQGFLSGQLSLPVLPSIQLLSLPNPYDPIENQGLRLHDASLYHGKYYLYFGPLPTLTFFIPFKILTNHYPSETLAVFFYLIVGFVINFSLLIKIHKKYFQDMSEWEIIFGGFILAFATTAPFLLTRALFYETAIASTYCAVSASIYFLFNSIESNFSKYLNIVLFSFFIALSVAGRPNFSLPCIVLIFSLFFMMHKKSKNSNKSIIALAFPAFLVCIGLCLYNYFRFDSIFQFGNKYQLAGIEISKLPPLIGANLSHIKSTLYLYFFQPFEFSKTYRHFPSLPHIHLGETLLPQGLHYYEPVSGVLMTSPISAFAFIFPVLMYFLIKNKNFNYRDFITFLMLVFLIPMTVIIFFMFCTLVSPTQRYQMDFTPYLIMLSIMSYWLLQKCPLKPWLLTTAKYSYIILGVISILIGFDIGITGYGI